MVVPIDSNMVAFNVERETASVRERDLPVEVIWQIPINLPMSWIGSVVQRRSVQ